MKIALTTSIFLALTEYQCHAVSYTTGIFTEKRNSIKPDTVHHGVAVPDNGANQNRLRRGRQRDLEDERCLEGFEHTSEFGCVERGYNEFFEALQLELEDEGCGHGAFEEVMIALDMSEEELFEFLDEQCRTFWEDQVPANLDILTDDNDVFMKQFFDGQTNWNALRQTVDNEGNRKYRLGRNFGGINDFLTDTAETSVVAFPEDPENDVSNFDDCEAQAVMCCWVKDRGDDADGDCSGDPTFDEGCFDADPEDNTDVCFTDMRRAPSSAAVEGGIALFPGEIEGPAHCHGFAWGDYDLDTTNIFRGNNLFYVSMYDHLVERGYVRNIPGAPMCACAEQMAVVTRADCTEPVLVQTIRIELVDDQLIVVPSDTFSVEFEQCEGRNENNDLRDFFARLVDEGRADDGVFDTVKRTVVGEDRCPVATQRLMNRFRRLANRNDIDLEDYGIGEV